MRPVPRSRPTDASGELDRGAARARSRRLPAEIHRPLAHRRGISVQRAQLAPQWTFLAGRPRSGPSGAACMRPSAADRSRSAPPRSLRRRGVARRRHGPAPPSPLPAFLRVDRHAIACAMPRAVRAAATRWENASSSAYDSAAALVRICASIEPSLGSDGATRRRASSRPAC